ncbi:FliA/WhiG family RNA polymerase sigma factor [Deferribacterales bacterium RsTz2092]|nr:DNA-directed RNA polymerase sigma-70 factor [Deferribacterales bacterium]
MITYSNSMALQVTLSEEERNKMVQEYYPFVHDWAVKECRFLPASIDVDEVCSICARGLIDCISKFDKTKDTTFKTYLEHRLRGALKDHLREQDFLSRTDRRKVREVEEMVNKLKVKLGRQPSILEVAERLGVDEESVHGIMMLGGQHVVRLDNPIDEGGPSLADTVAGTTASPEDEAIRNSLINALTVVIDSLPSNERTVVSLRYFEDLNMKEIAEVLGVTESRVSQLHSSALVRARKRLKEKDVM